MPFGASATDFGQFQASTIGFGQISDSAGHILFGTATNFGPSMDVSTSADRLSHYGRTSLSFRGWGTTHASTGQSISKPRGGSSVVSYCATQGVLDVNDKPPAGKILSISAMPNYINKSHEELRSEDYELNIKGTESIGFLPEGSLGSTRGSGIGPYVSTQIYDETNQRYCGERVLSISAMPVYKDKCHEELRFEDYEEKISKNKGVDTTTNRSSHPPISNPSPFGPFRSNPFAPTSQTIFGPNRTTSTTPMVVPSINPSNPFSPQSQTFRNPSSTTTFVPTFVSPFSQNNNTFAANTSNLFTPTPKPALHTITTNPFSTSPSLLGPQSQTFFTPMSTTTTNPNPLCIQSNLFPPRSQDLVAPTSATSTTPNPFFTQSNLFPPQSQDFVTPTSTTTTTTNPFSTQGNLFPPQTQAFVTPTRTTTTNPNPFYTQSSLFPPQSQAFVSPNSTTSSSYMSARTTNFNSSSSQAFTASTTSTVFPSMWPTSVTALSPSMHVLNASRPGQISTTNSSQLSQASSSLSTMTEGSIRNINGQQCVPFSTVGMLPRLVENPFGPQSAVNMSIAQPKAVTSIRYGISSLPVKNDSVSVRTASSFRIRHVSSRRIRLSAQRHDSGNSGSKVPFFGYKEDIPCFVSPILPRENPRTWITHKSTGQEHAPGKAYKKGQFADEACEDNAGTSSCFQVNVDSTGDLPVEKADDEGHRAMS